MAISMSKVRKALLDIFGIKHGEHCDKLPADFSTHPSWVTIDGLKYKVLSQAEACLLYTSRCV